MNFDAFTFKDVQNFKAFITYSIGKGVTDLSDLSRHLENYANERHRLITFEPDEAKIRYRNAPKGMSATKVTDSELHAQRRQRALMAEEYKERLKNAPECPSCDSGKLARSCGGAMYCTSDCGYSTMGNE